MIGNELIEKLKNEQRCFVDFKFVERESLLKYKRKLYKNQLYPLTKQTVLLSYYWYSTKLYVKLNKVYYEFVKY